MSSPPSPALPPHHPSPRPSSTLTPVIISVLDWSPSPTQGTSPWDQEAQHTVPLGTGCVSTLRPSPPFSRSSCSQRPCMRLPLCSGPTGSTLVLCSCLFLCATGFLRKGTLAPLCVLGAVYVTLFILCCICAGYVFVSFSADTLRHEVPQPTGDRKGLHPGPSASTTQHAVMPLKEFLAKCISGGPTLLEIDGNVGVDSVSGEQRLHPEAVWPWEPCQLMWEERIW